MRVHPEQKDTLTDLEMTKLCAEAMGLEVVLQLGQWRFPTTQHEASLYDPLHDDAQAMALGKAFPYEFEQAVIEWCNHKRRNEPYDMNYELCGRIAKTQRAA